MQQQHKPVTIRLPSPELLDRLGIHHIPMSRRHKGRPQKDADGLHRYSISQEDVYRLIQAGAPVYLNNPAAVIRPTDDREHIRQHVDAQERSW